MAILGGEQMLDDLNAFSMLFFLLTYTSRGTMNALPTFPAHIINFYHVPRDASSLMAGYYKDKFDIGRHVLDGS